LNEVPDPHAADNRKRKPKLSKISTTDRPPASRWGERLVGRPEFLSPEMLGKRVLSGYREVLFL
jgi:hypothetical protein